MVSKVAPGNNEEQITISQKITDFLVKFRVLFISVLVALVIAFTVLLVVTTVIEKRNRVAFEKIENLVTDWEAAKAAPEQANLTAKEDEIVAKLLAIGKSNKNGLAGARAYMSVAEVYYSRKDWKNAQENYVAAAKADGKAYTAGPNFYNAAMCADEQGNSDEAVELFNKAVAQENFPLKARAYFNIGRIEEQRSHAEAAIAAYEKLAEQFPDDTWASLAKSRIIKLQIK